MLTGDSEPPQFSRPSLNKAASPAVADKSLPQLQPGPQPGSSKHCSVSFSSDSAHVPVPVAVPVSQAPDAPGTPAHTHNKAPAVSPQRIPTISPIALPSGIPAQTSVALPKTHSYPQQPLEQPSAQQAAWESGGQGSSGIARQAPNQPISQATNGGASQSSCRFSSLTAAQQQASSAATSQVASSASPAHVSSAQVWRSNPAYGVPPTPTPTHTSDRTPSSHRASQSLPSFKAFTSVDRRMTDSWRAKLLEDLGNESDSERDVDIRMTLPVVSEHDSLPALMQQWGLESTEHAPDLLSVPHQAPELSQHAYESSVAQTAAPAHNFRSGTALYSMHRYPSDAAPRQGAAASKSSHSHTAQAALPAYNSHESDMSVNGDSSLQPPRQAQQHDQTDRAHALQPEQDLTRIEAGGDDSLKMGVSSMPPPAMAPLSLLSDSNLEVVKARSNMLDIPSAELLDSILDFANAVCGEQQNDGAYSPLKVATLLLICFLCCSPTPVPFCIVLC